jgi:hypothetical protein
MSNLNGDLWFVFCTFGELTMKEIVSECQKDAWAPILHLACHDGRVIIPCFLSQPIAIRFAQRNLPKNQIFGCAKLPQVEVNKLKENWVKGKGWLLEVISYPKILKNQGRFHVDVHQYMSPPDIFGVWGNNTTENIQAISLVSDQTSYSK